MIYARFLVTLKKEFLNWKLWAGRSIVLSYAAVAGLTIVGFTKLAEFSFDWFLALQGRNRWAPLFWTPIVTIVIVYLTRKFALGSAGSGIPQVIAALDSKCKPEDRGLFVSLKLSIVKIFLTSAGLLGGLSLGREGPSVQIAAGIMRNAKRWLPSAANISEASLIMAGGAAGIAAAFRNKANSRYSAHQSTVAAVTLVNGQDKHGGFYSNWLSLSFLGIAAGKFLGDLMYSIECV